MQVPRPRSGRVQWRMLRGILKDFLALGLKENERLSTMRKLRSSLTKKHTASLLGNQKASLMRKIASLPEGERKTKPDEEIQP
jgi:hypothetical protein